MSEVRSLSAIAREVRSVWPKVHFAAEPYLAAMSSLNSPAERFGYDSGDSIIRYFLSNARGWRGADAKRIKAELNAML